MNKKIITAASFVLGAALVFCGCSDEERMAGEGFEVAGGEYVDYTFEYPATWEKTRDDGMIAIKSGESNVSISVTSFRPTEVVESAEEYYAMYKKSFEETLGDFNELSVEDVTLDGAPAKKVTYTATVAGDTYKFASVICMHNYIGYSITYTATEADFEAHAPTLAKVIQSFDFEN